MRKKSWLAVALILASITPIMADNHSDAKAQVEFGIAVAQKGLWKEALVRWKKATDMDKNYAAAWNDLAIAYEQLGQFSQAREAYDRALQLAKNDSTILQNYAQFRDIYDRQNRRQTK